MYYDEILDKMLPGIYITINNKTEEGYKDVFSYIKYYIDNILKDREKNIILKLSQLISRPHFIMHLIKYLTKKKILDK